KAPLNHQYLIEFCKSISKPSEVNDTSFINLYNTSITHFRPYLEDEIIGNLLQLEKDDKIVDLDYVRAKVLKTPLSILNMENVLHWLEVNNEKIEDCPYFKKVRFDNLVNAYCNRRGLESEDSLMLRELQKDFFKFASHSEVKKVIEFIKKYYDNLNEKKEVVEDKTNASNVSSISFRFDKNATLQEFQDLHINNKYFQQYLKNNPNFLKELFEFIKDDNRPIKSTYMIFDKKINLYILTGYTLFFMKFSKASSVVINPASQKMPYLEELKKRKVDLSRIYN